MPYISFIRIATEGLPVISKATVLNRGGAGGVCTHPANTNNRAIMVSSFIIFLAKVKGIFLNCNMTPAEIESKARAYLPENGERYTVALVENDLVSHRVTFEFRNGAWVLIEIK